MSDEAFIGFIKIFSVLIFAGITIAFGVMVADLAIDTYRSWRK